LNNSFDGLRIDTVAERRDEVRGDTQTQTHQPFSRRHGVSARNNQIAGADIGTSCTLAGELQDN
jgi:hypothetical protein